VEDVSGIDHHASCQSALDGVDIAGFGDNENLWMNDRADCHCDGKGGRPSGYVQEEWLGRRVSIAMSPAKPKHSKRTRNAEGDERKKISVRRHARHSKLKVKEGATRPCDCPLPGKEPRNWPALELA
jgi:hypothetical protein